MASGCSVPVIRPLLEMRRSELAGVVAKAGLDAAADPSNADDRFDRVRIRRALEQADWIDPVALARSAHLLGEAEETFAAMTDVAWEENVAVAEGRVTVSLSPWREINLRLLERALAVAGGRVPRSDVAALIDRLSAEGAKSNLGGVLVERSGNQLVCRPEPPRRSPLQLRK
jgi:tRNA(Ile)-lysidine synthase